jgi:hypothetical protein
MADNQSAGCRPGRLRSTEWGDVLDEAGLAGPATAVVEAVRPLGPVLAHVLWFLQPMLALFGGSKAAGSLANLLNDPVSRQPETSPGPRDPSEGR